MQDVSAEFKAAAFGPVIQPVREVEMVLLDNGIIQENVTATGDTIWSVSVDAPNAANGITSIGYDVAYADTVGQNRVLPGILPVPADGRGGWWGNNQSDASGNVAAESLILSYTVDVTIKTISWYSDEWLGYPVDFVVYYDIGDGTFLTFATVNGWDEPTWTLDFDEPTEVARIKITVTRVSYGYSVVRLLEFAGEIIVDISESVASIETLWERQADNATLQVGNSSANSIQLEIDNTQGEWSPRNRNSPYYGYLRENRKIRYRLGFRLPDGTEELIPFGTFYTTNWSAQVGSIVSVSAQDRMKMLRDINFQDCPLFENEVISDIIEQALLAFGFHGYDYELDTTAVTVPYAWADPDASYLEFIQNLAAAAGGTIYFDEEDVFRFNGPLDLISRIESVITFTDDNAVISLVDEWDEGESRNTFVVNVNSLNPLASAQVWEAQDVPITIYGGEVKLILIRFGNGVLDPATPAITASDPAVTVTDWTAYGAGGLLEITNSDTDTHTITAITVNGQELSDDGSFIVQLQDAIAVGAYGQRDITIDNPFIQSKALADQIANDLFRIYRNPPAKLSIETVGLPHLQLGDRVTVDSEKTGISGDYWIIRHQLADNVSMKSMFDLTEVNQQEMPRFAVMYHHTSIIVSGNAIAIGSTLEGAGSGVCYQSAAGANDQFTNGCWLAAGGYQLKVYGLGATSGGGVIDWYIDNNLVGSHDFRDPSGSGFWAGRLFPPIDIILNYDGWHTIKGLTSVTGRIAIALIALVPSGDY